MYIFGNCLHGITLVKILTPTHIHALSQSSSYQFRYNQVLDVAIKLLHAVCSYNFLTIHCYSYSNFHLQFYT